VLGDIPLQADDRVLVDFRTSDDAGVYAWDADRALVQTVDFFTPVVDDPWTYGQVAAANALSDVYAMGGRPLTALAVAAFPMGALEYDQVKAIFAGGLDKLNEAGVALLGGHTVQDREVKFGYAITGEVHPRRVWRNTGSRPGDALVLTKPIGTGIIATAIKFQRAPLDSVEAAVRSMTALNRNAAAAASALPDGAVHACTDVTGFGLVGHAVELADGSGVTLEIESAAVPLLPGVLELAGQNRAGGLNTNEEHFGARAAIGGGVDPLVAAALHDPQTSGGLLLSIAEDQSGYLLELMEARGVRGAVIGRAAARGDVAVRVR